MHVRAVRPWTYITRKSPTGKEGSEKGMKDEKSRLKIKDGNNAAELPSAGRRKFQTFSVRKYAEKTAK